MLNDEKIKENERWRNQCKIKTLEVNNNRLSIEINKNKQEVVALKNEFDKIKQKTRNNECIMNEHFESKGCKKTLKECERRHQANKELKKSCKHKKKGRW